MTGPDIDKPPLAVIAGPTAAGKSALALALAARRRGTIINADASQLYADLRILSARPDPSDEALVPHRLYGVIDAADPCSAARWAAMATAEVETAWAEGRLPILVGGTGLYLRALLDGVAPVPPVPAGVRAAVRAMAPADVRRALLAEDPEAAARLHPNDRQRNARALEVIRGTGRPLAAWQQVPHGGLAARVALEAIVVAPSRDLLYARCDQRFAAMIAAGALDEVVRLRDRGLVADLPVMKALGVPPLLDHLAGRLTLPEAIARAQQETRHYAKRQLTWFVSGGQARGWLADARHVGTGDPCRR